MNFPPFPLLPLPGSLEALAEMHMFMGWLSVVVGVIGIMILLTNAIAGYARGPARAGYFCLGCAVVGIVFGVYTLLVLGPVVLLSAYKVVWAVFIKNAKVAFSRSEKTEEKK